MSFELPELGYAYDSLEPFIDAETMEIHYSKHFEGYKNNLNIALAKHPEFNKPLEAMLADLSLVPKDIRTAVQNHGGGYFNHALYFSILKINDGQTPNGELGAAISIYFGSFEEFKEAFSTAAASHFGSGWVWLIVTDNGLKIVSTANQDTPLDQGIPILNIDIWEHAYYLNYQNRRAEYITSFFSVINWDKVEELYLATK
ncbi:MAG: superoxide dismutase [Acholeplasmataceae bacterium]|nr:superoxide dismutase [Acholeplasmataceae bacterium]